jgi:hypothetical protein
LRKDQRVKGQGKAVGEGEGEEEMIFSDKRLKEKEKFVHSFSMWRKPEFASPLKEEKVVE